MWGGDGKMGIGAMNEQYDVTGFERGKFYIRDAILAAPPVYLDSDVLVYVSAQAGARRASMSEVVNDLLRDAIAGIEAAR